jgi:hypothetical protein
MSPTVHRKRQTNSFLVMREAFLRLAGNAAGRQSLAHISTSLITPEEARNARRINGHRISAKPHTAAELLRVVEESLPCCAEA